MVEVDDLLAAFSELTEDAVDRARDAPVAAAVLAVAGGAVGFLVGGPGGAVSGALFGAGMAPSTTPPPRRRRRLVWASMRDEWIQSRHSRPGHEAAPAWHLIAGERVLGLIPGRAYLVGRDQEAADIWIFPPEKISRKHAALGIFFGGLVVLDEGSLNGTWVNGEQLRPNIGRVLKERAFIRFADVVIEVGPGFPPPPASTRAARAREAELKTEPEVTDQVDPGKK
jgi:hypothetical protein